MKNVNRKEMVSLLCEAADIWTEAIRSGRLGFDDAVKEYVENYDNVLSASLKAYVQALPTGTGTQQDLGEAEINHLMEIRRATLHQIATDLHLPEVTAFVTAVLESQDKRVSIVQTLQGQSERLHKVLSKDYYQGENDV